ncbi:unnamed protein product [Darwinula stevensoni]|uniref:C2H2-type domain-containing protein n=1 Tax=Darwinula stevensoni TaxID=69355 RepID=A0A7R8X5D9_9CRUS|nr:unnamed protein product [Darwinula stevensoni]CAG0880046.1 unnamed protein product [Darwinula stevensoni]
MGPGGMDSSDPWPVILGPPPMEPLPYLPYLTPCLGWPALLHNRSGSRLTFTSPACTVVSPVVCHALPISSPPVSAFHVPPPVKVSRELTEEAESRDEPESVETTRDGSEVPSRHFFSCPHCNYRTDRKNNLRRHVATMHHSTPGKFPLKKSDIEVGRGSTTHALTRVAVDKMATLRVNTC